MNDRKVMSFDTNVQLIFSSYSLIYIIGTASTIRNMPKGAKDIAQRFNKQVDKMYKMIMTIVFTILFSSISIAAVSVGQSRKSQCPLETKIPTWLIVYGIVGIVWNTMYIIAVRSCILKS